MKKKRCTEKIVVIPGTIYPVNIYVFLGSAPERVMDHIKNIYPEYNPDVSNIEVLSSDPGSTLCYPNGEIVIYLHDLDNIGLIVHEAFHATEFILRYVGMTHSTETSEAYAYLLQYIVNEIIK